MKTELLRLKILRV